MCVEETAGHPESRQDHSVDGTSENLKKPIGELW